MDESKYHLSGGELLDEARMSEIKSGVMTEETSQDEAGAEHNTDNIDSGENEDSSNGGDGIASNITPNENNPTEMTETETEGERIVYWTESGTAWHTSLECFHISDSDEIFSGTEEEAKDAKKKKLCSTCKKKYLD